MFGAFFAIIGVLAVSLTFAEYRYDRAHGRRWYGASDALSNFNLGAGNVFIGNTVVAAVILVVYRWVYDHRPVDLVAGTSGVTAFVVGLLVVEFIQYWQHRWSHTWNVVSWGHLTHHSSSYMNLSTGVRISWFYRAYAWVFYLPMAMVGFPIEQFVLLQTAMNAYNLCMHTRFDLPYGPLAWVLVTPMSHRIHHSAEPHHHGNYGAALVIWDRVFGTHHDLGPDEDWSTLRYGMGRNVDATSPVRLSLHYLQDLIATARALRKPVWAVLFSTEAPSHHVAADEARREPVSSAWWAACALLVVCSMGFVGVQDRMPLPVWLGCIALGVAATWAFGRFLAHAGDTA